MAPTPCPQLAKGAVAAAALLLPAILPAQTTWTGMTSTDWNTATNWSPATLPGSSADVFIDLQSNLPVLSSGSINLGSRQIWVGNQSVSDVSAPATLTIQSGAQLTSGAGNIGSNFNNGDSPGAVTVTGAGSKWTNTSVLMA